MKKDGIPDPCKTCGSSDRYWDSKGYARCRDCRKATNRKLGEKKISSGVPPTDCPHHKVPRQWNNFGNAECSLCRLDYKKELGESRRTSEPPSDCEIHNSPRTWNGEGTAICRICIKERAKDRYKLRTENSIPVTPCPVHNCDRQWNTYGEPYCAECSKEYKQAKRESRVNGPPPTDCEIHKCKRTWDTGGDASCVECNRESRKRLYEKRLVEGPPSDCEIHNCTRKWNAAGTAICNECINDKNRKLGEERKLGQGPENCEIHKCVRYWDTHGRPICRMCFKESVADLARRRKAEGDPPNCEFHGIATHWTNDGRALCVECRKEYRRTLDRLYYRWVSINDRCHNPNSNSYYNYGDRGIYVYPDWRRDLTRDISYNYDAYSRFKEWVKAEIGDIPEGNYSLDRIDNNRGYEPGNLRWTIPITQANNQRTNVASKMNVSDSAIIPWDNKLITVKDFSDLTGIELAAVKYRWSQHPGKPDWILNDDYDRRYYPLGDHLYNLPELCLITGIRYKILEGRLRNGWPIERAIDPCENKESHYSEYPLNR